MVVYFCPRELPAAARAAHATRDKRRRCAVEMRPAGLRVLPCRRARECDVSLDMFKIVPATEHASSERGDVATADAYYSPHAVANDSA